jgi:hypothetical protein
MPHRDAPLKVYRIAAPLCLCLALAAGSCERNDDTAQVGREAAQVAQAAHEAPQPAFQLVGKLQAGRLDEASGIQAGRGDVFYLHNDEGSQLFAADAKGRHLGTIDIAANNRDWEDLTRVPGPDGSLLVIGDIGDNAAVRKRVSLYFLTEPATTIAEGDSEPLTGLTATLRHRVRVTYPDGPRDAESLAYDAAGGMLLILTKRDRPPRLYGIPLDLALLKKELQADFLAEVPGFRPPTRQDILKNPGRGLWVSQPTGMDISPDGRRAAVITYRSLYLFERTENERWPEAFQRAPLEIVGPPGAHDEAVGFSLDGRSVYVASEGVHSALYRLDLP